MLATISSGTLLGLTGRAIDVEVDVAYGGFPSFTIVGLPGKAVDESKDRVRTAIINSSLDMPESRITVNLAPADVPKSGSSFDLPIAVGILKASQQIPKTAGDGALFVGELSLEGHVKPVPGVISLASLAKEQAISALYVAQDNAHEASLVSGITVYPVSHLSQLALHLQGHTEIIPYTAPPVESPQQMLSDVDFAHVRGQYQAKRALEIAAAGFHNVHLKGVPGAGKTMLARAFTTILPPLDPQEQLDVIRLYSVAGQTLSGWSSHVTRPFRSPHHTTSRIGLIGGSSTPRPGEISLAHRGVLFLDEFPEFPRSVLEALRQPLEDGVVSVSRAAGSVDFPARFLLVAASNPCPCGYLGHPKKRCSCSSGHILRYKKRLSGPILDRIDLHVDVAPVNEVELLEKTVPVAEGSNDIRNRVMRARARQQHRFAKMSIHTNAEMSSQQVRELCQLEDAARTLLEQAIGRMQLSARATFKVIKVAQTIADLATADTITSAHIAESLQYRVQEP